MRFCKTGTEFYMTMVTNKNDHNHNTGNNVKIDLVL